MWRKEISRERNPTIAGYRIGDEIGRGPLGTVYEAVHTQSGERVVFRGFSRPKRASLREWDDAMAGFVALLEKHKNLGEHPGVQRILDFGEESELFWIASEFFTATPFRQILDERGPQPLPWALQVLGQVAAAVDWAGQRGLPHTDLTPYNILVAHDPQNPAFLDVKVINFGIGHARAKRGTPYAAPEQQRGAEGDSRSDAWALGALLCEIVSEKPLFTGKPREIVRQVIGARPALPNQLPGTAHAVLDALLAPEPDRRYHRLTDAVADLDFGREPAFAKMGKRSKAAVGSGTPLAIQRYSLGKMDLVDLRDKKLQKDLADDARAERRGASMGRALNAAALLGVFGGLLWRASTLSATFETATVAGVSGTKLHLGQKLSGRTRSRVATGPGESVVLTFRGGRLLVPENSTLQIGVLGYGEAAERRFKLERGRLIAETLRLPAGSVFEVAVGDRRIFTRTGKLALSADGAAALASGDGHLVAGESRAELTPGEVPDWGRRGLAALAKTARPTGVAAAWLGGEENLLLPMWVGAKQIVSLPSSMVAAKKTLTAQAAVQALAPLIQTATLGEGAPEKLDPVTLAPLAVPEANRKKLLRSFVGGRIDRYRRFPSGGWEILAWAADGRNTPLRLRSGRAGQVPREERFAW